MENQKLIVKPGPRKGTVVTDDGDVLQPPSEWGLLPPGDAGLTRRVKAAGPSWTVQEKRGRKVFSQGVWAPQANIDQAKRRIERERASPGYARKLAAGRARRARAQTDYVRTFERAVRAFLAFDARYEAMAREIAAQVTTHATPVGSGTVARTERVPVEQRAEAAVIAWMRHQTTAYDQMKIARVKGQRREVRRALAAESRRRLDAYRRGTDAPAGCPLRAVVESALDADPQGP